MPALIPSPDRIILVTGANGYIAMWIIKVLLEKGFSVRGAVRSQQKADLLGDYFDHKMYGGRAKWVIVPNIQKADAFDEVVKGVDGIIHTASPLPEASTNPDDLIKPAVEGTVNILNSARKYGTAITRIVITSSGAAIIGKLGEGTTTFNETNWGDESVRIVEEQGVNAPPMVKYRASKTLAEKAAWQYYNTHKTDVSFDLITINPPIVVGPPLQNIKVPQDLSSSMLTWYNNVMLDNPDSVLAGSYSYVDIHDVALAHVVALDKEEAAGQRIIVSAGATTWQETRNLVNELHPELLEAGITLRGNPGLPKNIAFMYDSTKGSQILGVKYRDFTETVRDTLADFKKRGWLKADKNISGGMLSA